MEKLNIISKDKRIKEISVDLTGGVDSRCVFAALSKLDNREKFKCYNASGMNDNEFTIANTLRDILGIAFDYERREGWKEEDFIQAMNKKISCFLHKRLDPAILMNYRKRRPGTAIVNGADAGFHISGLNDVYFKEYDFVSRSDLIKENFRAEDQEALDAYLGRFAITGNREINVIKRRYRQSIEVWEGNDFQRVEKSYFQRARYHYSPMKEGGYGSLFISPLLSREIPKLFYDTFGTIDGFKVEFDVLFTLNSLLAIHEYKNPQYNRYVLEKYSNYSKVLMPDKKDVSDFLLGKSFYDEKKKKLHAEDDRLYRVKNQTIAEKTTYLKSWCLEMLFYMVNLIKDEDIEHTMFYSWFFLSEKIPDKVPPVHNRAVHHFFITIASIVYQLKEVEDKVKGESK